MRDETGKPIDVGNSVSADGMRGIVVCDFDNRRFAVGYEQWDMPTTAMANGSTKLSSGIMIDTKEAGLVWYREATGLRVMGEGEDQ